MFSLSQFENALRGAHKDLLRFTSLERTFDCVSFFKPMHNNLEKAIQEAYEIELRVADAGVIMIRSKPRMSCHVEFGSWTQYWPVPPKYWINKRRPMMSAFDGIPDLAPLQLWPKYSKVSRGLWDFYSDPVWCTDLAAKYEMTTLLRKWVDDPRRAEWNRPRWPDWSVVTPPSSDIRDVSVPAVERRRSLPLIRAPYDRLGALLNQVRPERGRGGGRRGGRRGRGRRGRGGRGGRGGGRRERGGRGGRGGGRRGGRSGGGRRGCGGRGERGGGRGERGGGERDGRDGRDRRVRTHSSSSEEEFTISSPQKRKRVEERMSDGSDSDKEMLSVLCSRLHRYPVGTKVRRHFDSGWFDGEVVSIHVHDKLWTIRYTDGDEEDFNEDQLIRYSSQYNQKYNSK